MTQRWIIALVFVSLLAVAPISTAGQGASTHPRLFFDAQQLQTVRSEITTTHADIWAAIKTYADSLIGTPPPASIAADATEEQIRAYGDMLIPLAFACTVTEQPDYCRLTRDYLMTYISWPLWDVTDRRDLALAHLLMGTALAYDWAYPYLTDEERQTIANGIADKAQQMYEASAGPYNDLWTNWWAGSYVQNHFSTNNSALGMAGLALAGDVERDTQAWITQASDEVAHISALLNGIQDGSWHESIHYQTYMLTMQIPFLVNLRALQGVDLFPQDYLRNYTTWRMYNYLPGRHEFILGYGDFEPWWANAFEAQSILRFIAAEYDDPRAEWLAEQILSTSGRGTGEASAPWQVFELLYYDPSVTAQGPEGLPLSQTFPDLGGVIWRTGWDENSLVFGLKGQNYGGNFPLQTFVSQLYPWDNACADVGCTYNVSHDHADANTFYLYNRGQWLATEWAGYGVRDTSSHNTIVIDGQSQFMPDNAAFTSPEAFAGTASELATAGDTPNFNYLASNATGSYHAIPDLHEFTRHVVFLKPDYLLMLDNLDADNPHTYQWMAHFAQGASIEDNWVRGDSAENQVLGVGIVSPQPFEAITSADALPYVRVAPTSQVADTRFIHILYPTTGDQWSQHPQASLVEDNGSVAVTSVQIQDGRIDDIWIAYGANETQPPVGGYSTDARVAVVRHNADQTIASIYLYGGTFLNDESRALIQNAPAGSPLEIDYQDGTVNVSGTFSESLTFYAPGTATLNVNGQPTQFSQNGDEITLSGE